MAPRSTAESTRETTTGVFGYIQYSTARQPSNINLKLPGAPDEAVGGPLTIPDGKDLLYLVKYRK